MLICRNYSKRTKKWGLTPFSAINFLAREGALLEAAQSQ